uniref:Protein kinase domain-containing protein n=1 Tax=Oryza punctata TaxID=4537 RepID=A0A0E0ME15_ORYPU
MPLLSDLLLSAKDENEPLCFEALKPRSTELHRLIIRGQWAKGTLDYPIFRTHSKHLKYLSLSFCNLEEDPLRMLASHLLDLTYLRLNNVHSANKLVLLAEAFPKLKTLILKQMPDVNQIKFLDGALPCIEGLYIVSLLKLDKVPQGIESLSSLKKVWLMNLHKDFETQWNKNRMHQKMLHVAEVRTTGCTSLCNGDELGLSEMDYVACKLGILEDMLEAPSATPISLPLELLKAITCSFADSREIGRGGYGVVYKGLLPSGKMIAVKKLFGIHVLDDNKFRNEVCYLMDVNHPNIVRFLGYCAETRMEVVEVNEKHVMAELPTRLLCFEYVRYKSLDTHISDESSGLDWRTRYQVIRGICHGLLYLHDKCSIVHLDLKPENILMDDNMVPKIADFGLSRIFAEQESRIITSTRVGSLGYVAPEYLNNGLITTKSDIFSFGVLVIELMTGRKNYPQSVDTSFQCFTEKVLGSWMKRLETTAPTCKLEIYSEQINIMDGGLPCIQVFNQSLHIVLLLKLDKVPQGIEFLSSLKKLWLRNLHKDFKTQWNQKGMHQKMLHVL